MKSQVSIRVDDRGVAYITIDNSAKLNCLTTEGMTQFARSLAQLESNAGLKVAVLSGAGNKAFVGGASIDEMAALGSNAEEFITLVHRTCDAVRRLPVPVIARIDGYALGAGLELAAACDFRICSEKSVFAMPEVRLGIPSVVEAVLLPGLIGWGRTRMLLLTGRSIDARTAVDWGLVEEVTRNDELDAAVDRCVAEILSCGSSAVRLQKRLISSWETSTIPQSISESISAFTSACGGAERKELMDAYLAERLARSKNAS
ncbi:MAG: enoyl-CoA hydratase/isomerase family protein [Betaproteobacteria bacterium]|nr:enoyl-CoA hydratase/isomerase family protein [Betaproteobacteria bacterium]